MIPTEQKAFLVRRLRKATQEQPELLKLKRLLLKIGGEFLVAPPKSDSDVPAILEAGFVMGGAITLKPMRDSSCHQNVAELWRKRKYGIVGIGTGYALTKDGLWRQHTWGILRDGILETTAPRIKYFGLVLQRDGADCFAQNNPC